jgi:hypothetical protein
MFASLRSRAGGLATITGLGGLYYTATRPGDVAAAALGKTLSKMDDDVSARERALIGKLVRPVLPTSLDEIMAYRRIIAAADGLETTTNIAMLGGALLGAAAGIAATRRIGSWPLRLAARCVLVPPAMSSGCAVTTGVVLAGTVYTLRADVMDVLVPLGPAADAFARSSLPSGVVSVMEYKQPK